MDQPGFKDRRRAGGALMPALLLLLILIGAGGANYYRNMQAEAQTEPPRPFKGYAEKDLEALRAAYEQEAAEYQARYSAQDARRQRPTSGALMGENVQKFERVQAKSDQLRELRADVAESEARLRDVKAELQYRSGSLEGLELHLKRLLTI